MNLVTRTLLERSERKFLGAAVVQKDLADKGNAVSKGMALAYVEAADEIREILEVAK